MWLRLIESHFSLNCHKSNYESILEAFGYFFKWLPAKKWISTVLKALTRLQNNGNDRIGIKVSGWVRRSETAARCIKWNQRWQSLTIEKSSPSVTVWLRGLHKVQATLSNLSQIEKTLRHKLWRLSAMVYHPALFVWAETLKNLEPIQQLKPNQGAFTRIKRTPCHSNYIQGCGLVWWEIISPSTAFIMIIIITG